jgi:ligand-binding sensor domain-containing protein
VHARQTTGLWRVEASSIEPVLVVSHASIDRVLEGAALISAQAEAEGSLLLMSATRGLARIDKAGKFLPANLPSQAFFQGSSIEDSAALGDGRLAVATWDEGVAIIDSAGKLLALINDKRGGLPDNRVNRVLRASNHRLWIATRLGLAEWDVDPAVTYLINSNGKHSDISGFAAIRATSM